MKRPTNFFVFAALSLAFLYRLGFGLCSDLWTSADNKQIYLIGLKFYTTGSWPYFGPDVTDTIQIPGALQGLLVGLPFFVLPIPEAPYVLLSVLSFAGICFFAWYCVRRLPEVPKWLIWSWLLTAPWILNVSTNIYNPSYVLVGSIVFFVGALETYPQLAKGLIPITASNLMMGIALVWIMQLHLSWVILVPFLLASFYFQAKTLGKRFPVALLWFVAGAAIPASLLLPTYIKYGFVSGLGNTDEAVRINMANLISYPNIVEGILGRFLSFASFEVPRFIGGNTGSRLAFLKANPWLFPFAILLTVVGFLQPITLLWLWFSRKNPRADWKAIKYLTAGTVLLLYVAFLFSSKAPASHTLYVTIPIILLYSLYCWERFLTRPQWARFVTFLIVCGAIFHTGLAVNNFLRTSLYLDRAKIVEALKTKDFHMVGERRPGAKY